MADWKNMRMFSNAKSTQFITLFLRGRAHETFKEQIAIGKDGRPDFAARKACNYMETAIQVYPTLRLSSSLMAVLYLTLDMNCGKFLNVLCLSAKNLFRHVGIRWKENVLPTMRWIYL